MSAKALSSCGMTSWGSLSIQPKLANYTKDVLLSSWPFWLQSVWACLRRCEATVEVGSCCPIKPGWPSDSLSYSSLSSPVVACVTLKSCTTQYTLDISYTWHLKKPTWGGMGWWPIHGVGWVTPKCGWLTPTCGGMGWDGMGEPYMGWDGWSLH